MSWSSFWHNLFHHSTSTDPNHQALLNMQKVTGMLAVAQNTVDQLAAQKKWSWAPQFDQAMGVAVNAAKNWQPGNSTAEITTAITAVEGILNSVEGIDPNTKLIITTSISGAQALLVLLGQ